MTGFIILQDIRSQVYDKVSYESLDSAQEYPSKNDLATLNKLLDIIVETHKADSVKGRKFGTEEL